MRKLMLVWICSLASLACFGQAPKPYEKHQVSIDFGSLRNRYLFPITDLRYTSPIFSPFQLRLSARVRSYGTWYVYSTIAYDITPLAEVFFGKNDQSFRFSLGLGVDTRIRLLKDERSQENSSAEPLVSAGLTASYQRFTIYTPLWTRFYSNGVSFTLMPEISYWLGKRASIFYRYEASLLSIYNTSPSEFRQDMFLGLTILF